MAGLFGERDDAKKTKGVAQGRGERSSLALPRFGSHFGRNRRRHGHEEYPPGEKSRRPDAS